MISFVNNLETFFRYHLDYGVVIYDQAFNMSSQDKLDSVQHNAVLAITGAIKGSSWENP